jgi:hypothetical protein
LTWSTTDSGNGPAWSPLSLVNAVCLVRMTSIFWLLSVKIESKACVIWSRTTNVPEIIAVPSTIESIVRTERSLRPIRPRRITPVIAR